MSRLSAFPVLVLALMAATPALAQIDTACLLEAHSRYVEAHNRVFVQASRSLAESAPAKQALLAEFVEYQTRSNTLKAYVVAYIAARSPALLATNGSLARIVPAPGTGKVHQLMMGDATYRNYYPEWRKQTGRFIDGEGFSEREWQRFIVARNELNRMMGSQKDYGEVLKAYSWPASEICP